MNEYDAIKHGEKAMERDPRESRYGYFSGGTFALDGVRVFMWFDNASDLLDHLCNCDPLVHGMDTDEAEHFSRQVQNAVSQPFELSESNRAKVNEIAREFLCIEWWGTFDDLLKGDNGLASETRRGFRDGESDEPIQPSDVTNFTEYLSQYGF